MGYNPFKPHMSFKGDNVIPTSTSMPSSPINNNSNNKSSRSNIINSNVVSTNYNDRLNSSDKGMPNNDFSVLDNFNLDSNEMIALESAIDDALAMVLSLGINDDDDDDDDDDDVCDDDGEYDDHDVNDIYVSSYELVGSEQGNIAMQTVTKMLVNLNNNKQDNKYRWDLNTSI